MADVTITVDDQYVAYVQKFYSGQQIKAFAENLLEGRIKQDIDLRFSNRITAPQTDAERLAAVMALP